MLRVVKYAVCVKRPVPASRSFKAEERAPREVENCLRLLSFRRKINSVIGQDALHFAKIGFPAVPVLGFVILRLKVTSLETDDVPGNTEIRKHDPVLKIIVIRASLAFSLDGYIE